MPQIEPKLLANGPVIRQRRRELGITVTEFAELIGRSPKHVYNVELGHNGARIEILHRMARALELKIEDITVPDGDAGRAA